MSMSEGQIGFRNLELLLERLGEIVWTCAGGGSLDNIGKRMAQMELPIRRKTGRPQKRFVDVVKNSRDRVRCKQMIHCRDC